MVDFRQNLLIILAIPLLASCQLGNGQLVDASPATARPPVVAEEQGVWLGKHAVALSAASESAVSAETRVWQVRKGESLASALRRWAEDAGYTPVPRFSAQENWTFIVTQDYTGDFESALAWLTQGFANQPIKPSVILYANHIIDLQAQPSERGNVAAGDWPS